MGKVAEILLYEDIGDDGIGAADFARDLQALGRIDQIDLRINSAGGDVFEGLAIHNTLVRHRAKVTVDIDGMALSIASIIALAGDTVRMAENAMFMVHDPWSFMAGSASEMREMADVLDEIKVGLVTVYRRSGLAHSEISKLMSHETWMGAAQALQLGFIDSITSSTALDARHQARGLRLAALRVA
jgi:ATP-dependent protease ClpP protease subunit